MTVPEPVSVLEGESARFSCRISGVPVPRVSWFREDLQVFGVRFCHRIITAGGDDDREYDDNVNVDDDVDDNDDSGD